MIQVEIYRNRSNHSIRSFSIKGHAEYDVPGKDIVCAGVSAVTVGTVNAVEELTGVNIANQVHKGLLTAIVPMELSKEQEEKISLLLDGMFVMLRTIENSYGKYVAIKEIYD